MGKGSAPRPPSASSMANSQAAVNLSTALANNYMGMMPQNTPFGNLDYRQTGEFQYVDPVSNEQIRLPQFTAETTLTPQGQRIQDNTMGAQEQLSSLAQDRAQFLRGHMSQAPLTPAQMHNAGFNYGMIPDRFNTPFLQDDLGRNAVPNLPSNMNFQSPEIDLNTPPMDGQVRTDMSPNVFQGIARQGANNSGIRPDVAFMPEFQQNIPGQSLNIRNAGGGNIQRGITSTPIDNRNASGGDVRMTVGSSPLDIRDASGGSIQQGISASPLDIRNARGGTIQRGVTSSPIDNRNASGGDVRMTVGSAPLDIRDASGGNIQRGISASPLDIRNARGGDIQSDIASQGQQLNARDAQGGNITRSYSGDFSDDRRRVEDALMERMRRFQDRDAEQMRTQLANQGIGVGSDAYTDTVQDFQRGVNDARLGAILSAGEEQARMVGMERD